MERSEWQRLLRTARAGNAEAQWTVGCVYAYEGSESEDGKFVIREHRGRAQQWFRRAAEQGHSDAQSSLGGLLSSGGASREEFAEAIEWCKQAVEAGNAGGAHHLGLIYRDMGNLRKAYHWYQRTVEMGELSELLWVGLCQLFGIGTPRKEQEGFKSLRRLSQCEEYTEASPMDIEAALYWMGVAYLNGQGVRRSLAKARECFERADRDLDNQAASLMLWITGRESEAMC